MSFSDDAHHATATPTLLGGVGRREITTRAPGRRVRDPLFARALVFDDGATRFALVTLDVVAIGGICEVPDTFLPRLREQVAAELGIAQVMVNASHTHPPEPILCSPDVLLSQTLAAVREAVQGLEPVRVGAGRGREERISMNRNLRLKNGGHWTVRHGNPSPPEEEVAGLEEVDAEVGILRVDRADGTPLAVLCHFACHLLFGDPHGSVSANFPGVALKMIEECVGGGVMGFFVQGAAGDVVDVGFKAFHQCRDVEPLGLMLGRAVLRELGGIATAPAKVTVHTACVALPRRTDSREQMAALQAEQRELLASLRGCALNFKTFLGLYLSHRLWPQTPGAELHSYLVAEKAGNPDLVEMDEYNRSQIARYEQNLRAMERLATIEDELATYTRHEEINTASGSPVEETELQVVRIGEFVLLGAPIELLTEVGLAVKRASPHPYTFVAGFTNGYMHYGPRPEAYAKGGYEVIECYLAPEWCALFEAKAGELLREL